LTVTNHLYTISGYIRTQSGAGVDGLKLAISGLTTVTTGNSGSGDGFFSLSSVPAGSYAVTPQGSQGYFFRPGSIAVTVSPDATNVNFVAGTGFTLISRNSSGAVTLALYGPVHTNRIEFSTNLVNWKGIYTNLAPIWSFTDTSAIGSPLRFYRAVQQ
jgi:hypothetical protein